MNFMGYPAAVEVSETITFAAAPIIVIFPPRHAPKDRHHHSGWVYSAPITFCTSTNNGAIVAVYGILSIMPDKMPDAHSIIIAVAF